MRATNHEGTPQMPSTDTDLYELTIQMSATSSGNMTPVDNTHQTHRETSTEDAANEVDPMRVLYWAMVSSQ